MNKQDDLGKFRGIVNIPKIPINHDVFETLKDWMKPKKTPYDHMHTFMMNLPWPYPKNVEISHSFKNMDDVCDYLTGPNRIENSENEYNCKFISEKPESYIKTPNIWNLVEKVKEDPLLPGSDTPQGLEEYDITINYWGIDFGSFETDSCAITAFSHEMLDDTFNYQYVPGHWKKPLLSTKSEKILYDHQKYMKLLRKYNRLRSRIRKLCK